MKQLLLLVSLILLGLLSPKEIYKEQPSLADPNNPLSLTCPEYLPTEHSVNRSQSKFEISEVCNLITSQLAPDLVYSEPALTDAFPFPDWYIPDEPGTIQFGWTAAVAGDVNGDGFSDLLVGAPGDPNNGWDSGFAFLYQGSSSGLSATPAWSAFGLDYEEWTGGFGHTISSAGDINNDGYDDVLVAAPYFEESGLTGKVYLYLGTELGLAGDPVWVRISPGLGGTFGITLDCAGDVNNDGYSDIVIGTGESGQTYNGHNVGAYLFLGNSDGIPDDSPSWTASAELQDSVLGLGVSVSSAGDVNGDGFDDIILGASGKAFIYFGSSTREMFAPFDWTAQKDSGFGKFVSDAGDVNGDGFDDILVSAIFAHDFNGAVYMYKGSATGPSINYDWKAVGYMQSLFGSAITSAGDFNKDGYDDIAVAGLHEINPGTHLFLGYPGGLSLPEDVSYYPSARDAALSGGADFNGDTYSDFAGGLWYFDFHAGAYYGKSNMIQITPETAYKLLYEEHYFDVSLRGPMGKPISNTEMFVEIKGANPETLSGLSTDDSGNVEYFLIGYNTGIDTIIANATNVFDTAFVIWDDPNPVEMLAFNSSTIQKTVILSWSTSTELNNSGFEIQRAIENGKWKVENGKWSKKGFVNGSGTTNEPREYTFTDRNLETGKYKYRLKQLDFNGNFEYFELAEVVNIGIPDKYDLSQNYPNPFNPVTMINYDLPNDGIVTIKVYDILGRELKTLLNKTKTAGYHKIKFNAADLASGAYFYRLVVSPSNQMKAGDFVAVKRCVLIK